MADASRLLFNLSEDPNFHANLEPTKLEWAALRQAKDEIRKHLKQSFALLSKQYVGFVIAPRFFTQGSAAYKTLNRGAHMPPQQIDLDDGMYLPMSFMKNSTPRPSTASEALFRLTDLALMDLAEKKGWKFIKKPTCVRLEIIPNKAHIDVPLYAIPDGDNQLLEKADRQGAAIARDGRFAEARKYDTWAEVPTDQVLLAHREEDWRISDPRKIHTWFIQAVEEYGEELRRVCRYLKAWRDFHGERTKALSSILLMTCAFIAFEEIGNDMPRGDHRILAKVAELLPDILAGEIYCVPVPTEQLDKNLSDEDREEAIECAKELALALKQTLDRCHDQEQAIKNLRKVFGDRVPLRPDLVIVKAPIVQVMSEPRKTTPVPAVGRSTSG